jgi:hypothetical protein
MRALLALTLSAIALGACTPSICARKDKFFTQTCSGSALSYTGDPMCETYMENCNAQQRAQADGYVSCLEAAGQCSHEALGACQQKFPGGVNLMCKPLPAPS